MLPPSDGIPARRFPFVNVALIAANFAVFAARANGGGTGFFAPVGGFVLAVIVARVLVSSGMLHAGPGEPAPVGAAP
jgi:hypothetical protein